VRAALRGNRTHFGHLRLAHGARRAATSYFVFNNNGLYYYDDKPAKANAKPKGVFEITSKSIVRPSAVQKPFAFEVLSKPIVLRVYADNQMEANQWQAVLREAVDVLKQAELERGGVREHKMEGYLVKRAMTSGRNWKKRWFVLKGGRISYYEDRPNPNVNEKPKGVMELTPDTIVLVFPDSQSTKPNTFEVTAKKLVLTVSADSREQMIEWVQALDEQILAKAGIITEGAKEVSRWMRSIGLHEYARRFIDLGNDELATVWDMDSAVVKTLPKTLEMSRLESDYFAQGMTNLKKGKKPKSFKVSKDTSKPKLEVVHFPSTPAVATQVRLYTWGDNSNSQLGLVAARTGTSVSTPTHVDSLKGKSEPSLVSAGASATAIVTAGEQAVYTWGTGPLGLGPDKLSESRPYMVPGFQRIKLVAVGVSHMIAAGEDGEAYAWGGGDKGQLGLGMKTQGTSRPQPITTLGVKSKAAVAHVAVAAEHSLFVTQSGKVYACGCFGSGRLGIPATANQFEPVHVKSLDDVEIGQVACGDLFSVAVTRSGASAYWWGCVAGKTGPTLAQPTRIDRFTSRPISMVSASGDMGMFLVGLSRDMATGEFNQDASVFSWGADPKVLGHGDGLVCVKPTLVEGLEDQGVIQVCAGFTHAGVLTTDGRALLWGQDDCGQLGSSYLVSITRPSEAIRISGFRYTYLCIGEAFTCAIAVEDASVKLADEKPGTPLPPPPPPEEALHAANAEADELQNVLDQFAVFAHKFEMDQREPGPPSPESPLPPPPPEPPTVTKMQQVVGGKRILGPGSRDLGNGWIEHSDVASGKKFYENVDTGATQWVTPLQPI